MLSWSHAPGRAQFGNSPGEELGTTEAADFISSSESAGDGQPRELGVGVCITCLAAEEGGDPAMALQPPGPQVGHREALRAPEAVSLLWSGCLSPACFGSRASAQVYLPHQKVLSVVGRWAQGPRGTWELPVWSHEALSGSRRPGWDGGKAGPLGRKGCEALAPAPGPG